MPSKTPTHVSFRNSHSILYSTRPEQAQFIRSPVLFESNRVKNVHPSEWNKERQIEYMKADFMKR